MPDLDEDGPLLVAALAERGFEARPAIWDDPSVNWSSYVAAVVRTTWDYIDRRSDFVAWAHDASSKTRLANPADVLEWNTDKHYLSALATTGVPAVPTVFVDPGAPVPSAAELAAAFPGAAELVVKPAVGAGSKDAGRFRIETEAEPFARHLDGLVGADRSAMVQPYLEAIEHLGETALIFFGGRYDHAIRKSALLPPSGGAVDLAWHEKIEATEPTAAELAAARVVLDACDDVDRLVYARVDLVPAPDGTPLLIELECTEPDLFLRYCAGAATRFAEAVVEWISRA